MVKLREWTNGRLKKTQISSLVFTSLKRSLNSWSCKSKLSYKQLTLYWCSFVTSIFFLGFLVPMKPSSMSSYSIPCFLQKEETLIIREFHPSSQNFCNCLFVGYTNDTALKISWSVFCRAVDKLFVTYKRCNITWK